MPDDKPSWLTRAHPKRKVWTRDEKRMRASFHGRIRDLSPYLKPHRFEATEEIQKDPSKLDRAELGYAIQLNSSYLSEIFGHVREAPATYEWGPMGDDSEENREQPPEDTVARGLWEDATRTDTNWENFFQRKVLEWMLTSPGGFIVTDVPPGRRQAASDDSGRRPYVRFVPMSDVIDIGRSRTGFPWIKIRETRDTRTPRSEENELAENILLYELRDGETVVTRYDADGEVKVPENASEENLRNDGRSVSMGEIVDRQGQPTLPLVHARFGEHPDLSWIGAGAIMGLDDIVLSIYNTVSEMRTGYRDLVIALLVYRGPKEQAKDLEKALTNGTRYAHVGEDGDNELKRLSADSAEVDAGVTQIEMALKAWAESAKRKAAEAMDRQMSGVALQAEFQLDLAPLLREVTEQLDDIESATMHRLAQLDNDSLGESDLRTIGVERDKSFDPEDEASRIARIVDEAPFWRLVPAEAKRDVVRQWIESTGAVNMDRELELEGGETIKLREFLPEEIVGLAESENREFRQRSQLGATGLLGEQ